VSVLYANNTWTVSTVFQQSGVPTDPANAPTFTLTLPDGTSTTEQFGVGGSTIVKDSVGVYHRDVFCILIGNFTGTFAAAFPGSGAAEDINTWYVSAAPITTLGSTSGYPFPFGYCAIEHVAARVLGGTWNPQGNSAQAPTIQQTNYFIAEASADLDLRLARTGYTIPLVAQPSMTILPQVYTHLRTIVAELAAGSVLRSRHGSYDPTSAESKEAEFHIALADDLITSIEDGTTNLTVFGVAGPFEPDIDPAKAIQIPNLYDSTTGLPQTARFTNSILSVFDPR
jgi:hypothetical protein